MQTNTQRSNFIYFTTYCTSTVLEWRPHAHPGRAPHQARDFLVHDPVSRFAVDWQTSLDAMRGLEGAL